jgi:antirestriction protein ArdC
MNSASPPVKRDLRQEVTDTIIAALEQGVAPWQKPWESRAFEMLFNPTSGKPHRGGNAIHLMVVGMRNSYEDPRWLTYRQAQENGWQVRRGEKGTQIEFWQFPDARHSGHEQSSEDSPASWRDRLLYRVYTIFNARQIDGIPAHAPRVRQEWEIMQSGEEVLRSSGARISHDQADRAFYNRRSDSIHLLPKAAFKTPGDYYGTALYELAHWTGHPDFVLSLRKPFLFPVALQVRQFTEERIRHIDSSNLARLGGVYPAPHYIPADGKELAVEIQVAPLKCADSSPERRPV